MLYYILLFHVLYMYIFVLQMIYLTMLLLQQHSYSCNIKTLATSCHGSKWTQKGPGHEKRVEAYGFPTKIYIQQLPLSWHFRLRLL